MYFADNCIPIKIVRALAALDVPVKHLTEHEFAPSTPDEKWLPYVGHHKLILLSGDLRILDKPSQRKLLDEHSTLGVFTADNFQNLKLWDQAALLIRVWPDVSKRTARRPKDGQHLRITGQGKVEEFTAKPLRT